MGRNGEVELTDRELAAWRGFLEAHSSVIAALDSELEAEHSLPLTSYEVLMLLLHSDEGRMRMGELADRLLLSRSGITRLVDRLERQGLVKRERCTDDGRGYFAVLTPAGRDRVSSARPSHHAGVRRHFIGLLDDEDVDALARIWPRLLSS